jgi:hypothetical protein
VQIEYVGAHSDDADTHHHSARCQLALAPDARRTPSVQVIGHPIGDEWAIGVGHVVDDVVAVFVHLQAFVDGADLSKQALGVLKWDQAVLFSEHDQGRLLNPMRHAFQAEGCRATPGGIEVR